MCRLQGSGIVLYILIAVALLFDFTNGSNDVSNIIATAVSSRAVSQRTALIMMTAAVFTAPFLFGVAVASTLGKGLVDPAVVTLEVVLSAVIAAITWNLSTRHFGIPSSSSHALIGGLLGASIMTHGVGVVQISGLSKVLLGLFVSPLLGLAVGFFFTRLVLLLTRYQSTRINYTFKRLQFFTLLCLALSYGANDAQKTMGIITLGLVTAGVLPVFRVPVWVILSCATAISLGAAFGGWRLIRTLGGRIYRIRPMNAFASQLSSALVILGARPLGYSGQQHARHQHGDYGLGRSRATEQDPLADRPGYVGDLDHHHPAVRGSRRAGVHRGQPGEPCPCHAEPAALAAHQLGPAAKAAAALDKRGGSDIITKGRI